MTTDYDKLAATYDERYHQNKMLKTFTALDNIIEENNFTRILDVGCGTGYWMKLLNRSKRDLNGVDLSAQMLQKTKITKGINLIQGDADALPFKPCSFDFIYSVNAIHHFQDNAEYIKLASELLKNSGCLAFVIVELEHKDYQWYIYKYFNGTKKFDSDRIPPIYRLENWFYEFGFKEVQSVTTDIISGNRKGAEVFNDSFLRKEGSSTLTALSDEEYNSGIRQIKNDIRKNPEIIFPVNIIFKLISGKIYRGRKF